MNSTKTIVDITIRPVEDNNAQYAVIMLNDKVTPADYVVLVLSSVFGYTEIDAWKITMEIHNNGKRVVHTTSMQKAYAKVEAVEQMNDAFGFALQTDVEKV